jgi:ACS family pantothenate transporter-like MFS transporter
MTLGTTWVKNWQQLVAIRFLVGLFESGYYPGLCGFGVLAIRNNADTPWQVFLIGSWYTKDELGKRSNIFQAATAGGTLLSGVMQAGVYRTLNGRRGMPGWRWIFIIDAVCFSPSLICLQSLLHCHHKSTASDED